MKVICYGDSNTYGFDPRSLFGSRYSAEHRWTDILADKTGWTISNQGTNGQEIPRNYLMFSGDMDLLIVMLGTNDLLQGRSSNEIALRMERFLESISVPNLLLISPPPLQVGAWVSDNTLIENSVMLSKNYKVLAEQHHVLYVDAGKWDIDLAFDGVHFSEKGHRAFAEGLYGYLIHAGFIGQG